MLQCSVSSESVFPLLAFLLQSPMYDFWAIKCQDWVVLAFVQGGLGDELGTSAPSESFAEGSVLVVLDCKIHATLTLEKEKEKKKE